MEEYWLQEGLGGGDSRPSVGSSLLRDFRSFPRDRPFYCLFYFFWFFSLFFLSFSFSFSFVYVGLFVFIFVLSCSFVSFRLLSFPFILLLSSLRLESALLSVLASRRVSRVRLIYVRVSRRFSGKY